MRFWKETCFFSPDCVSCTQRNAQVGHPCAGACVHVYKHYAHVEKWFAAYRQASSNIATRREIITDTWPEHTFFIVVWRRVFSSTHPSSFQATWPLTPLLCLLYTAETGFLVRMRGRLQLGREGLWLTAGREREELHRLISLSPNSVWSVLPQKTICWVFGALPSKWTLTTNKHAALTDMTGTFIVHRISSWPRHFQMRMRAPRIPGWAVIGQLWDLKAQELPNCTTTHYYCARLCKTQSIKLSVRFPVTGRRTPAL